ncbi:hypothetical protein IVA91_00645 [Bradyrhizobium sp. 153]|nr:MULTISPECIES: hypothetical protein [unclassified Bradyrhizobium]MCK1593565.1 hypothetical protein [Bradyrhizobium sp. 164]MCK1663581.1 hypothetical protein [Bradyrhizobium sp. 153]
MIESCILLGLSHSASKGLKFGKLRKKRLSAQAQDNAVVRPITVTHCTPPMFEELAPWVGSHPRIARVFSPGQIKRAGRATDVAFPEVGRQLKLSQVFPAFRVREEFPFVHAVVRGLLTAQRTHRAQASHLLHCEPPSGFFQNIVGLGWKVSQIKMTGDSPVFDRFK